MESVHRRFNLLTGDWVLVSPHRNDRPWSGATEAVNEAILPNHDSTCPLCASNTRANEVINPDYKNTFVFTNDFSALKEDSVLPIANSSSLFVASEARGVARVICFSPQHNKTLAKMTAEEIFHVVQTWKKEYSELSKVYACIHIFENKGDVMGCSQPHPHGQIWAHSHYSSEVEKENLRLADYFKQHKRDLLGDYIEQEKQDNKRIVCENEEWICVVPYWAKWPFETILIAKAPLRSFSMLNDFQSRKLSEIIRDLTVKYDNVFNCNFPYSMGWHNAPSDLETDEHWRLHAHFYPPLLRSASIKKHMVGYEMLAESQRDITPEQAAKVLQDASTTHYLATQS